MKKKASAYLFVDVLIDAVDVSEKDLTIVETVYYALEKYVVDVSRVIRCEKIL
jgi:hypothetical protein